MRALLRTSLPPAALLLLGCVTITEADPRRSRGFRHPEPIPKAAWVAGDRASAERPAETEWIEPTAPHRAGLLVFLEGEGGGPEQEPMLERFAERGFRILRVRVDTLVEPPLTLDVRTPDEIEEAAGRLAAAVDGRLAEVARVVERRLDRLAEDAPTEPQRPLVLGGVGLGACFVPAVAARLGKNIDASILIGGGASLFEVVHAGSVATDGVELALGALTEEQRRFFGDIYLSESRLDPYHTARFLGGKPVLMIHARFDDVVPHWSGDMLHARLGAPKRLRVLGDHDDLLDELQDREEWIVAWTEGELRSARRS